MRMAGLERAWFRRFLQKILMIPLWLVEEE